jgi:hypothetical protein
MSDAPTEEPPKTVPENKGGILQKTGEILHKVADATIFTTYGNNVDGAVTLDGALAKDVAGKVTHPGGGKKE